MGEWGDGRFNKRKSLKWKGWCKRRLMQRTQGEKQLLGKEARQDNIRGRGNEQQDERGRAKTKVDIRWSREGNKREGQGKKMVE